MRTLCPTAFLALLLTFAACGAEEQAAAPERCAHCGMLVETAPRWIAGTDAQRFDTPKCLFRWSLENGRDPVTGWVSDYYAGERLAVGDALFVVGSDVLGPMGDDLVPMPDAIKADLFVRDHGGRVVPASDVDATLLRSLDPQ